jgi:Predicted DNA modification methylase
VRYAKFSMDDPFISMAEVRALVEGEVHFLAGVALLPDGREKIASRSSTVKVSGKLLSASHDPKEVNEAIRGRCFSIYPDVILGRDKNMFRALYSEATKGVETSKRCPKLDLVFTDGVIVAGIREEERDSKSLREHSMKPFSQSGTMDPFTSRLMVNLARVRKRVLDPFVGVGSILLESAWMGLDCVGVDVDPSMVTKAKANLSHFNYQCHVIQGSVTSLNLVGGFHVVTDPPYGRSSSAKGATLRELYAAFLSVSAELMERGGRLVFASDSREDWRDEIRSAGLKTVSTHLIYLHKSLSRAIYVVERG